MCWHTLTRDMLNILSEFHQTLKIFARSVNSDSDSPFPQRRSYTFRLEFHQYHCERLEICVMIMCMYFIFAHVVMYACMFWYMYAGGYMHNHRIKQALCMLLWMICMRSYWHTTDIPRSAKLIVKIYRTNHKVTNPHIQHTHTHAVTHTHTHIHTLLHRYIYTPHDA